VEIDKILAIFGIGGFLLASASAVLVTLVRKSGGIRRMSPKLKLLAIVVAVVVLASLAALVAAGVVVVQIVNELEGPGG
jgi:hypothetical protein